MSEPDVRNVQILLRCDGCGRLIDQDELRKCIECAARFCLECDSDDDDLCIDCWEENQEEEAEGI